MTNASQRYLLAAVFLCSCLLAGCNHYSAGEQIIPAGQDHALVQLTKPVKNGHGDDYSVSLTPETDEATLGNAQGPYAVFQNAGYPPCATVSWVSRSSFDIYLEDCGSGVAMTSGTDLKVNWSVDEWND